MGKKERINEKKDGAGEGQRANNGFPEEVVEDSRFTRIHNDPRFQRLPRHKAKVPIDSRFAHMFHDKRFADKEVDKRGGPKKSSKQTQLLRRYYEYDEKHEEQAELDTGSDDQVGKDLIVGKEKRKSEGAGKRKKKTVLPESGSDGEVDEESHEEELEQELPSKAKARKALGAGVEGEVSDGELAADSDEDEEGSGLDEDAEDEEESSSSSSSSSESESEDEEESKSEEKVPTTEQETKRLALMNMDWGQIRAVDLLVVLRSFVPKGGNVESVTIYPSEFGLEQMAKEASQGPQGIFTHDDDGSEDEADPEKLREYEKAKLRYYYAVAICDSVATASGIYNACDGLEYEKTANTLDLRFVPDEMKFVREPKDSASDIPDDYKPVEFETKALQHSHVKLTWDDDEPLRAKALRRKFNADQLNEQDYRDYIASSSSSDSESESEGDEVTEEEKVHGEEKKKLRNKYLSLLSDGRTEEGNVAGKKVEKGNIEIKFNTGLDELSEKLTEKIRKTKTDETVWEAYLRKKKEKRKAQKNKAKDDTSDFSDEDGGMSSDGGTHAKDDPFFSRDEDPFQDPFFQDDSSVPLKGNKAKGLKGSTKIGSKFAASAEEKRKKKAEAAQEKQDEERTKAELELLLMDDDLVQKGVAATKSQKDSVTTDSKKKKKKKKGQEKAEGVKEKLAAAANYEDPRFANLFTSHHFAIDPTDPQFKKSAAQLSTIAEKQRQRLELGNVSRTDQEDFEKGNGGRKRKAELSSLVRSLKSKVQARR